MFAGTVEEMAEHWQPRWRKRAAESYREVCCQVGVDGDGTVPVHCALLQGEGVRHVVLDGVFHAMNAPTVWYGSDEVVDKWVDALV